MAAAGASPAAFTMSVYAHSFEAARERNAKLIAASLAGVTGETLWLSSLTVNRVGEKLKVRRAGVWIRNPAAISSKLLWKDASS